MLGGRRFLLGFVSGVLVALAVVSLLALGVARRGVGVAVNLGPLASSVREQVRAQAARSLPELIEGARQAVPAEVAAQVKGKIGGASLQIADLTLTFPSSVVEALEGRVVGIVEAVVNEVFDQMDTETAADRLADEAEQMVRQRFGPEVAGVPLEVRVLPWLTVPVVLTGK
ncbi:MAG: hypothetical protein ACYC9Q_12805 [Bacillota bacterium]